MPHTCHATRCSNQVPPRMFMCRAHWFSLPTDLRNRIWANYRGGQETDKRPSRAYCQAAKAAVQHVAAAEGITADTELYDFYLRDPETT